VKGFVAAAAEEDEEAEAEAGDEGGRHGVPAAKGEEKSRAPAAAESLDGTRRARLSSGDASTYVQGVVGRPSLSDAVM
jgi:hypothetical protein